MKRAVLLIVSVLIFILFPVNSFAEEEKEVNWELKAYQNELRALRAEVELGFTNMLLRQLKAGWTNPEVRDRMRWLEQKIEEMEREQEERDGVDSGGK